MQLVEQKQQQLLDGHESRVDVNTGIFLMTIYDQIRSNNLSDPRIESKRLIANCKSIEREQPLKWETVLSHSLNWFQPVISIGTLRCKNRKDSIVKAETSVTARPICSCLSRSLEISISGLYLRIFQALRRSLIKKLIIYVYVCISIST